MSDPRQRKAGDSPYCAIESEPLIGAPSPGFPARKSSKSEDLRLDDPRRRHEQFECQPRLNDLMINRCHQVKSGYDCKGRRHDRGDRRMRPHHAHLFVGNFLFGCRVECKSKPESQISTTDFFDIAVGVARC